MNRTQWVTVILVAAVFAGGGFWAGTSRAQNQAPAKAQFGGAGRGGGAFLTRTPRSGGPTFGTVVAVSGNSITVQLQAATSTGSSSGSKIVLYDTSTQVSEQQSVPASNISVGQTVSVMGTANADGSVTATSIQILPAGLRRGGSGQ